MKSWTEREAASRSLPSTVSFKQSKWSPIHLRFSIGLSPQLSSLRTLIPSKRQRWRGTVTREFQLSQLQAVLSPDRLSSYSSRTLQPTGLSVSSDRSSRCKHRCRWTWLKTDTIQQVRRTRTSRRLTSSWKRRANRSIEHSLPCNMETIEHLLAASHLDSVSKERAVRLSSSSTVTSRASAPETTTTPSQHLSVESKSSRKVNPTEPTTS